MIDHRSVSTLSEVLRQAIENEEKLINELALPGAKLEIKQVNNTHAHYCTKQIEVFNNHFYLNPSYSTFITPPTV